MKKALILFLMCMVPVFAAAKATGAKPAAESLHRTDSEIEQVIKAKLAKSKIGKDGFTFRVKGGVVTWDGNTNVIQHKGSATRMARTAGATQVVNNIRISDAARSKAAKNLTGGVRRAEVKTN
jgi:hypothetical protein